MHAERFFDANVLVYAFASNDPRSATAEALLAGGGVLGVQALNELATVMRRKLSRSWEEVEAATGLLEDFLGPARPLTATIHRSAVALARRHSLSFCDALIVGSAQEAGCTVLLSEDLQHGSCFGSLRVQNPFRT